MKTTLRPTVLLLSALLASTITVANAAPASENWENNCASCHGADGKGDTKQGKKLKLKDYTDAAALAEVSDEKLNDAIANGVKVDNKERMKGFADELSAEEVADLVKYVRGLSKK